MFASAARALLGAIACPWEIFRGLCVAASPLFFSTALVAAPLLRVVLDLELYTLAMARMDGEEGLMRTKVE